MSETEVPLLRCARCGRPIFGHEFTPGAVSSICSPGEGCQSLTELNELEEEKPKKKSK